MLSIAFRKLLLISLSLLFAVVAQASKKNAELYLSYEQRLVLSYVLLGQGQSSQEQSAIFDRAFNHLQAVTQIPVKEVKVKNFNEFLSQFRGEWPDTNSLALDLQIIESKGPQAVKLFVSDSPRVQRQIENYIQIQEQKISELSGFDSVESERLLPLMSGSELSKKSLKSWFIGLGDTLMTEQMSEIDKIGEKIAESGFAKQQDAQMRIFMQTMFAEYFSRLSPESKKMIISTALGGNLLASDIQKFEIMVQNSGPQLQKLLQVVARQAGLDGEMLKVFRALENSVRPVPWVQVEQILKKNNKAFKFIYFEHKPLGVGTMAQVHRAKISEDGARQDVVVRFIKPDIEKRVDEDKRILTEVAKILDSNEEFRKTGTPKLEPIIEDITKTVIEELSQKDTIERQKLARSRYQRAAFIDTPEYKNVLQFNVPKIYESSVASDLMVQEMVIGRKLDKEVEQYKDIAPELKKSVIQEMARLWAKEVIFGGGFFHSDLHQGNFMMQVTEPQVKLHILDFGMGGVISHQMQGQVMLLGAGTELNKAELITRAFWSLNDKQKSKQSVENFARLVKAKADSLQRSGQAPMSLENWTVWALDNGIQLPYEFISLNRGIAIINKLLQDSGSALNMGQLMKELAMRHPMTVYKHLVLNEKMSHKDLIKLGWAEMKSIWDGEKVQPPKTIHMRCESVFL